MQINKSKNITLVIICLSITLTNYCAEQEAPEIAKSHAAWVFERGFMNLMLGYTAGFSGQIQIVATTLPLVAWNLRRVDDRVQSGPNNNAKRNALVACTMAYAAGSALGVCTRATMKSLEAQYYKKIFFT